MILNDLVLPIRYTEEDLLNAAQKHLRHEKIRSIRILKRSIDARKKPDLKYVLSVEVNRHERKPMPDPVDEPLRAIDPVIVVGSGPAGLFAAFTLLKHRIPILILERGRETARRVKDVETFFTTGILNPESNVQFGEGGAGTFSDGKLNTGNKRSPEHETVLRTFVECGAPEAILYDAKPHVGTDVLRTMIPNLRRRIERLGGVFRFSAKFTGWTVGQGEALTEVTVNETESIPASAAVLSIGHSARDTYRMLFKRGVLMAPKAFAAGFRMEHTERSITLDRYGTLDYPELGAAPYKLTAGAPDGRGVYSFCMCPGGYVVNASSEHGHTVVNGMSDSLRNAQNSNAAIVVQVNPTDYPDDSVLGGIRFQESLEERAFSVGNGRIPVMRFGDLKSGQKTVRFGSVVPSMKGLYETADLTNIFPSYLLDDILFGVTEFGRIIRGFDQDDALVSAVESRTSSPVRILRNDRYESSVKGIFPAGEGAGYAGGILSSAADGIRTAEAVFESLEASR